MEPTSDEILLTAYQDGELSPQERQHLEQRLASEPELRQHLAQLDETWHCLDLLEQEGTDAEQIETTLTIAAVSVSAQPFRTLKISRFWKWSITLIVGLTLFIGAFQMGKQSPLDNPSFRQKVERLDMYLAISDDDGLELVRQLAMNRVFLPSLPADVPDIAPQEYEPRTRGWFPNSFADAAVGYHHEFDDEELYQLLHRNIQTYNGLSHKKAKLIQKLHHDIETAPRRAELLLTLQNYYYWFRALQPYEKTDLRKPGPIAEKVAAIIKLKVDIEQEPENAASLIPNEIVGIEESSQLAETLAGLPPSQKERLLNDKPHRIINELKQSSPR